VIAMTERRFVIVLNVGVFVLLLVLVMEVAGMRHLLRRLEHEQRRLVRPSMVTPFAYPIADSFWQNATDGAWILVPPGPCSDCRGPFYHRFFTKQGCEGALAEWNAALNEQRVRQAQGLILLYRIGMLGNCEERPLRP
jgi:hypothetical protein